MQAPIGVDDSYLPSAREIGGRESFDTPRVHFEQRPGERFRFPTDRRGGAVTVHSLDDPYPAVILAQWLWRGTPTFCARRWYFTESSNTAPVSSCPTAARCISCQGVWLGGMG